MVHNTIHEAFTNHNWVLANTIGNVMKEVFFRAPVDQVGPSYFNGYNPSAVGSSVPSSSDKYRCESARGWPDLHDSRLKN